MSENPTPEALEPVMSTVMAEFGNLTDHVSEDGDCHCSRCTFSVFAIEQAIHLYGLQMRAAGLRSAESLWQGDSYPGTTWRHEQVKRWLAEVERQIQEAAHG